MGKRFIVFGLLAALVLAAAPVFGQQSEADKRKEAVEQYKKALASWSKTEQIKCYTKAIELVPNWAYPYNNRGVAYFYLGDFDKAIADFDKAIELKPGYKIALENRAGANFNKKDASKNLWDDSFKDRRASGF